MAFTHLHTHSEYSLLDGLASPLELAKRASELGMKALALTDHGYMYGTVEFYRACKKYGIKPIIGQEFYKAPGSIYEREDRTLYHLVLLAKNQTGYHNLITLSSIGATSGRYYKPRIDFDLLEQYHEGLICLSGCVAGEIPTLLLADNKEAAVQAAERYRSIFGEDFYIELQYHGLPEQKKVLPKLISLSKMTGIQMVATNDVHYLKREDADAQQVMMCMAMKKTRSEMEDRPQEWYLKSEEEMSLIYEKIAPQAISNTEVIADQCNFELEFGSYHLPAFPTPEGFEGNYAYFVKLVCDGMDKKYGDDFTTEQARRISYEAETIRKMGFTDYFLIVADIVRYAKEHGIAVGPGRGSAVGSMIAYCLDITDVEPTQYGLLFERFLNPERVTMPDIDIDIEGTEERKEIIRYMAEKYGQNNISQIITFSTMAARAAIRDVGKVIEADSKMVSELLRIVPNAPGTKLQTLIETNTSLQKIIKEEPKALELLTLAQKVEGKKRHTSVHAAGLIIAPSSVTDYIPITTADGEYCSQYYMGAAEAVGMLKIDLLVVKTLAILKQTAASVASSGSPVNLAELSLDDPDVYRMLSSGASSGVFQLESEGIQKVLRDVKPSNFEELVAVISLYRPGPMEQIPTFIANKNAPEKISYAHPLLEPILKDTYFVVIYQEQVMRIVQDCAGYSLGRADLIRRAMAKKDAAAMAAEQEVFINGKDREDGTVEVRGCLRNGLEKAVAERLWDEMASFAAYSFNRSHAVAYAVLTYQAAYLKCHYPQQFAAASLTNTIENTEKFRRLMSDTTRAGIKILPPSINHSEGGFTVEDGAIRFGLLALKHVGQAVAEECISERRANGEFAGLQDLISRCPMACTQQILEALVNSGAVDQLGANRAQMLQAIPTMLKLVAAERKAEQKRLDTPEMSFFTGLEGFTKKAAIFDFTGYDNIPELNRSELLSRELASTGLYLSGSPLEEYQEKLKGRITHDLCALNAPAGGIAVGKPVGDGDQVRVAGVISSIRETVTRKKAKMAFLTMEDQTGTVEVTVFPKSYEKIGSQLVIGTPILIYGKVESSDYGYKLIADSVQFL